MQFSQFINQLGGSQALDSLGQAVGLDRNQVANMIDSLAPMVVRGLQHRTVSEEGATGLRDALSTGNHARYIDNPSEVQTESAREDGLAILGHIFGDRQVHQNVATEAATRTGLDTSVIEQALPQVAGLIMAALSKHSNAGQNLEPSPAQQSPLGSVAAMFDFNKDGQVLDDIIGMAKRYL